MKKRRRVGARSRQDKQTNADQASPQKEADRPTPAAWPTRLFFLLWLAWVILLAWWGRTEWGRSRLAPAQQLRSAPAEKENLPPLLPGSPPAPRTEGEPSRGGR